MRFDIKFSHKEPLYIELYSYIKSSILNHNLKQGERLPSKRELSSFLNISLNTVMEAYNLLLDEELIEAKPKKGYYVLSYDIKEDKSSYDELTPSKNVILYDFSTKNIDTSSFPYYTWNKISKNIIYNEKILNKTSSLGYYKLRNTIKKYLYESKGINVNPNNIIIGSGIEYLLSNIIDIMPSNKYTIENPGYDKIYKILKNKGCDVETSSVDKEGFIIDNIKGNNIYITPSTQFPTGVKMSMKRKMEISKWATGDKYVIEDDLDSEFKYLSNQQITIFDLNKEHTILLSTYSRSITPALRIAYMVLPDTLMKRYLDKFNFYSTTVSTIDQMILDEFIRSGAYSRHLNKTKALYKIKRETIIKELSNIDDIIIDKDNGYLSLIIEIPTLDKDIFIKKRNEYKIDISLLDEYFLDDTKTNKIVIGYSGILLDDIDNGIKILKKLINESKK